MVVLSSILTRAYGAALVVLALAGAANYVKVEQLRAAKGDHAYSTFGIVFTIVVLGAMLLLGIQVWRQRIWAMWIPTGILGFMAVTALLFFPAPDGYSANFLRSLGGGILLFGGLAIVCGAVALLATFVQRQKLAGTVPRH
jgi:hypothetical protein